MAGQDRPQATEEEATQAAKRDLIETYAKNIDLLPEAARERVLLDAFKRAEEITAETRTSKHVFDWITKTRRGDLTALWLAMRRANPSVTFDQADELWSQHKDCVHAAAVQVIDLSMSTLGNDEPPPPTTVTGAETTVEPAKQ